MGISSHRAEDALLQAVLTQIREAQVVVLPSKFHSNDTRRLWLENLADPLAHPMGGWVRRTSPSASYTLSCSWRPIVPGPTLGVAMVQAPEHLEIRLISWNPAYKCRLTPGIIARNDKVLTLFRRNFQMSSTNIVSQACLLPNDDLHLC